MTPPSTVARAARITSTFHNEEKPIPSRLVVVGGGVAGGGVCLK